MPSLSQPVHLNHDDVRDRALILGQSWPGDTDPLVLDELHKIPRLEVGGGRLARMVEVTTSKGALPAGLRSFNERGDLPGVQPGVTCGWRSIGGRCPCEVPSPG